MAELPPIEAMDDIRILDVSSFLAGPYCSTQLAEFGAEVWKVELPKMDDALRRWCIELGLTPHARTRLAPPPAENAPNPFLAFKRQL